MLHGDRTWTAQLPLRERWTLVLVDRAGYGRSSELSEGEDFELDAELLAPRLDGPTHLVGHSSGAVAAMLVAARRPEAVASLTLIEPPVLHLAPEAAELTAAYEELWDDLEADPVEWLQRFFTVSGEPAPPAKALRPLSSEIETWRRFVTRPWHAELPLDDLAGAAYPALVVSGHHHPAYEAVCDRLAERIGAEREVMVGGGHLAHREGAGFNPRLERLFEQSMLPSEGVDPGP
jgi:pimeloyl-ACP methyl ester carboxylesterase